MTWKKLVRLSLAVTALTMILSACNNTPAENDAAPGASIEGDPSSEPQNPSMPSQREEVPKEPENDGAADGQPPASARPKAEELPQTKDIQLTVEGMQEVHTGTLAVSEQGYYLYTLPQFTFSAEEPGKDVLLFQNDDSYFVRLEHLPPSADRDLLRANAEAELGDIGQVSELQGEEIFDPYFRQAEFFLHASNSQVSKNIVVIEVDGSLFRYTMYLPNGEAAEGVGPSFWSMLKTVGLLAE